MEAWKETANSEMGNSNNLMGELQSRNTAQYLPTQIPPLLAERDKPPDRESIALRSNPYEQASTDYPDKMPEAQDSREETAREKNAKDYISLVAKGDPVDNNMDQVVRLETEDKSAPNEPRNFESYEQRAEYRTAVDSYWNDGKEEEVLRWRRMLRGTGLD
ncbi:hypothetical protein R1flu_009811 [Riccia fluitans]|uniref:Uncharacterized protein n=1 Tax=Riccia fluitans TaxID=41844 RepID=A0ABD1Z379_9MARC